MVQKAILLGIVCTLCIASMSITSVFGDGNSVTETTPLNANIGIEKTTITMTVPNDNKLPWGFVEGKVSNPVPDYPVIIQIYDNDDSVSGNSVGAVLFAQTQVNSDGTYEYKFRVLDTQEGNTMHIFKGEYTVKIFKVVYLKNNPNSV